MSSVSIAIRKDGVVSTKEFYKSVARCVASGWLYEQSEPFGAEWPEDEGDVGFAPSSYGLIVIDMDTNWIGGVQSYTSFDRKYVQLDDNDDVRDLKLLWAQGRVKEVEDNAIDPTVKAGDFNAFLEDLKKKSGKSSWQTMHFTVDHPKGWPVEPFEETENGWGQFTRALIQKKFSFSEEVLHAWRTFFQEQELSPDIIDVARAEQDAKTLTLNTKQVKTFTRKQKTRRI